MDATDQNDLILAVAEREATEIADRSIYESYPPTRSNNGESAEVANNTVTQHGSGLEPGGAVVEESNPSASQIKNAPLANRINAMFGLKQVREI